VMCLRSRILAPLRRLDGADYPRVARQLEEQRMRLAVRAEEVGVVEAAAAGSAAPVGDDALVRGNDASIWQPAVRQIVEWTEGGSARRRQVRDRHLVVDDRIFRAVATDDYWPPVGRRRPRDQGVGIR